MWVLAGLCIVGFVLGQIQNSGRTAGRSDFVTRVIQGAVSPAASVVKFTLVRGEDFFMGVRDANKLRTENALLSAELEAMRHYTETVDRLRSQIESLHKMNDYAAPPNRVKVFANVIGYFPAQNSITLDRGSNDGIRKHMPVVAAKGLVGIVEVADPTRSRVLLVTSRAISVPAMVVGEPNAPGLIHGETTTRLAMDFFEQTPVVVGAPVVTSGFSEDVPAGIPIGIVIESVDDPQTGRNVVFVLPNLQMGEINEVYVLR